MLRHIVMWKFRPGTEAERDLFLTGLHCPPSLTVGLKRLTLSWLLSI